VQAGDTIDVASDVLNSIRRELRLLRDAPAGRRFIRRYKRMKSGDSPANLRWARIGASGIVFLAGLAMLVMPGPGILVSILGLAMLGGEFRRVAVLMDAAELKLREWLAAFLGWWYRASTALRIGAVTTAALAVVALGYGILKIVLD
jgi:hypothetical protein